MNPAHSIYAPNTAAPDGGSPLVLLNMPLASIPAAAIFDCDGTLADTMPLHYQAWRETLDPLGVPFPEELFYLWGGVTAREIIERLNILHARQMDPAGLSIEKEETYSRLIPLVRPIESVIAEARRFFGHCPLAVASGGRHEVVEETLCSLGIRELFDAVVGSEDVRHGKPAPDVFLTAAARIGAAPDGCVVYEDAPAGLEAARRAGMRAVDITRFLPVDR